MGDRPPLATRSPVHPRRVSKWPLSQPDLRRPNDSRPNHGPETAREKPWVFTVGLAEEAPGFYGLLWVHLFKNDILCIYIRHDILDIKSHIYFFLGEAVVNDVDLRRCQKIDTDSLFTSI